MVLFSHLVTNFQLFRTTPRGLIDFCKTLFATISKFISRDSNQMCDVTSLVFTELKDNLYKRVAVVN